MTREQAKQHIKAEMAHYLSTRGIDASKPFRCLNPDHDDRNPSMRLDPRRNKVHCFACGADYDTFDLIGHEYGLTEPREIFQKAYDLFAIQEDGRAQPLSAATPPAASAQPGADLSAFFAQAHRHIGETDYPQRRGLSRAVIDRFQLGYVAAWRHPKAQSAPASPRLIVPTSPHSYLARDTREALDPVQAKYAKSKVGTVRIFNSQALQTATRPIFIVEGELDALSLMEVGGEAIAVGSVSNRRALLKLLESQRPAQPLILALDNDDAGQKAAQEIEEGLRALDLPFYRINPFGMHKDANDALLSDRDALAAAVAGAEHVEDEAAEARRAQYLQNSTAYHLQGFINGIADSVDTPTVTTGFERLDEVLDGGLYEGLYIFGAISSLGKTTLLTQLADQIAQGGADVQIFSLEMARTEIMAKSISRHTIQRVLEQGGDTRNAKTARGITTGKRYARYSPAERALIQQAIQAYGAYAGRIFISEGVGNIGAQQVREAVRDHIDCTGRAPVVIVDYLQILAPASDRATDKQNTDRAVLELKRISRDYKTPVIAISSFNRQNYKEAVTMEAFKESGAVEYSSDILIGLQLASVKHKDFDVNKAKQQNPRKIELVILKNRNGRTGNTIGYDYYPLFNYFKENGELS